MPTPSAATNAGVGLFDIAASGLDMTDSDPSTTNSTATRHRFTNDILSILLVAATISLAGGYAAGVATVTRIPLFVSSTLSLATLTAVAWAFGPEMLAEASAARQTRSGGD